MVDMDSPENFGQISDREEFSSGDVISFERQDMSRAARLAQPARVALIGNFAPRKCGIATFTSDIVNQLARYHPDLTVDVYAMQDAEAPAPHGTVHDEIERGALADYARAARRMNEDGVDAVWLQHEFGIFGGECGTHILHLVERIAAPLIVTLHTVLSDPGPLQEEITRRLVERASRIMVMGQGGRDLLVSRYGACPDRISIIEHGAPDRILRPLRRDGCRTLMTFGLLGPGKGLETAIEALPAIVARHPDTVYRIAGVSHPNEVARNGEAYRDKLVALAETLGVSGHIEWIDRFLGDADLINLLEDCDIYLTPYPNLQQSTSGTLSYAVALGRAVVSTPYVHARELLGDAGGVLVPPGDPAAISRAVNGLLDNPDELEALQRRTYQRGRRTVWPHFAGRSAELIRSVIAAPKDRPKDRKAARDLVQPGLAAFEVLCDGTGIHQHGRHIVPDRDHGYCLDDNARALMLVHRVPWRSPGEELQRATTFASFVQHAWNPDRRIFRNFMNFDRTWCEDEGSQDSNGRAIWVLGDTAERSRLAPIRHWGLDAFNRHASIALDFDNPRSVAFAALGAVSVLRLHPGHDLAVRLATRGGEMLHALLARSRRPDWAWFEALIGYDNPRLSEALIACGEVLGHREWVSDGLDTLAWIMEQQTSARGYFRAVGSESFGRAHEILPFDQQPLEAWAAIDACAVAAAIEPGNGAWTDHARRAYRWFLGENDRGVALADIQLGTCMDGINPHGANLNCGAESLLAFQLAYYGYEQLAGQDMDKRSTPAWDRSGAATRRI
jgi:glycosyltransferase involved in cell wall biosynthesis